MCIFQMLNPEGQIIYFILFQIYNHSGNGHLTLQEFIKVLNHTLQMCDEEAEDIFYQINKNNQKHITFGKQLYYHFQNKLF